MATAGALEHQELMSEGTNLSLLRCSSLKGSPSRRKQREDEREHVAEKLQRRLPKFDQFSQNGFFGRKCAFGKVKFLSWIPHFYYAAVGINLIQANFRAHG